MNVYQVVSEPIAYQEIIDAWVGGPWYDYCIAVMVAAPTPGRAKWIAWGTDDYDPSPYIPDMPKFSVKLIRKAENWPEGEIVGFPYLWTSIKRPWTHPEIDLIENFIWQEQACSIEDTDQQDFWANGFSDG